jgi:AbrB family looped-hinge helix DNA binding protein
MTSVKKQTATLDQDGPLSIPTGIREAAHLKEGDTVLVEAANGGVVIRPIDADQAWTSESKRARGNGLYLSPSVPSRIGERLPRRTGKHAYTVRRADRRRVRRQPLHHLPPPSP